MASKNRWRVLLYLCLVTASGTPTVFSAEPVDHLKALRQVDPGGKGNAQAANSIITLTESDASILPMILREMDGANPLAANWLRNAFETIAERELKQQRPLPAEEFETFVVDRTQNARARRLAYEWLIKLDPTAQVRLIPSMLDDPSSEFRRDAVKYFVDKADALKSNDKREQAIETYRNALSGAVHDDQVRLIVSRLKEFDIEVNVQEHFGFLADWQVVGPFDNTKEKGLDIAYPPEEGVELGASYEGSEGPVKWIPYTTSDEYGIVDLASQLSPVRGSLAYAVAEFDSPVDQTVEIWLGTPNAWKLWLNGNLLFERNEYHRGMSLDQYRIEANLVRGKNTILLKACQNEQTQDWAQRWQFQLRICDSGGAAIHLAGKSQPNHEEAASGALTGGKGEVQ